jgi:hypothetical protein
VNILTKEHINQIVDNLLVLKALSQGKENIKIYLQKEYMALISSFRTEFQKEKEKIEQFFINISSLFPNTLDIPLHTIHGDIKPGNLIQKQHTLFFIDWERTRTGNNTQDIQKTLYKFLGYAPMETDKFINILIKSNVIDDFQIFWYLELFYYFLSSALDMLKGRMSLEEFEKKILLKCNQHMQ